MSRVLLRSMIGGARGDGADVRDVAIGGWAGSVPRPRCGIACQDKARHRDRSARRKFVQIRALMGRTKWAWAYYTILRQLKHRKGQKEMSS